MKSKIILLILTSLFLFCIKLNDNKKETIKQNDTITIVDNNHVSDIEVASVNDYNNGDITINTIYPQYSNISDITTTISCDSNHSGEIAYYDLYKYFNVSYLRLICYNDNTQYIPSKTFGLIELNNDVYFNMYLYHSVNKLGFT